MAETSTAPWSTSGRAPQVTFGKGDKVRLGNGPVGIVTNTLDGEVKIRYGETGEVVAVTADRVRAVWPGRSVPTWSPLSRLTLVSHAPVSSTFVEAPAALEPAPPPTRFPHTCPVCAGACYQGWSLNPRDYEHPEGAVCPPVQPAPEIVRECWPRGPAQRDDGRYPEKGWLAEGRGYVGQHPTREGAIAAWREAVAAKD